MLVVVLVGRDVVDVFVGLREHRVLPGPERVHVRRRGAARDELQLGLHLAHGTSGLGGDAGVLLRRLVTRLPGAVHLVAQAPHLDSVRVGRTVLDALVGPFGATRNVAVLEDVECLGNPSGAQVDGHHRFDADLLAPLHELVDTHRVGVGRVPREVESGGPVLLGADPVLPAVAGHEVAAWVAHRRRAQFLRELGDVLAEAVLVGSGVGGLVDAVVDAPARCSTNEPKVRGRTGPTTNAGLTVRAALSMVVLRCGVGAAVVTGATGSGSGCRSAPGRVPPSHPCRTPGCC